MDSAPIYFFPTTAIIADDHSGYLQSVMSSMNWDQTAYQFYTNSIEAYQYIEKTIKIPFLLPNYRAIIDRQKEVNLNTIFEFVSNPKRFSQLSLLLIDHEMPGLTGLAICEKLKENPLRKILITGEAEVQGVNDALNQGIIHGFITKGSWDFTKLLNDTVAKQQQIFLQQTTTPITDAIFKNIKNSSSPMFDNYFIKLHAKIVKDNNICEYYLIDIDGSYMFFDVLGNPSLLIVKSVSTIESDYNLAKNSDFPPSDEVLRGLKEGNLILHIVTEEEKRIKPSAWKQGSLIYSANVLKCENGQTYYYAYINNAHNIDKVKIISFRQYIESIA